MTRIVFARCEVCTVELPAERELVGTCSPSCRAVFRAELLARAARDEVELERVTAARAALRAEALQPTTTEGEPPMTTTTAPRSHVCRVCASPVPEDRYDAGLACCSRRCERVDERIGKARDSGDRAKLDRALEVKREILRESVDRAAADRGVHLEE